MTGSANSTTLGSISVEAHPTAPPLIIDGRSYVADELNALAEGC